MPVELCWSCRKLKDDVRLCGDDRLCRSCDVENERKLAEIRAKQSVDAVSSTKTRAASNKMQNKVAPKCKIRQSILEGLANQRKTHTYIIITYLFKFSYLNFLISVISYFLVHYFIFPLCFVYIQSLNIYISFVYIRKLAIHVSDVPFS